MAHESLIITGSCDEPMRGRLRALHGGDGSPRWERWTGHPLAGAGLALTGDIVVAASDDRSLTAWRVDDGTLLWEMTVPERHEVPQTRATTRVAAAGHLAVVLHGKHVFAVNALTGEALWEYARPDPVRFAGLLGLGRAQAYVTEILPPPPILSLRPGFPPPRDQGPGLRPTTRALSLLDGAPQWTTEEHFAAVPASDGATSLVERDGIVYTYGNGLHALDAATGAVIWSQSASPTNKGSALALWRDILVAVFVFDLGAYTCATGVPVWQASGRQPATPSRTFSNPVIMGSILYTAHGADSQQAAYIEGRDPATGAVTMRWPDAPTTKWSGVAGSFRGASGMLYVPGYDGLHAVRAADGRELWHTDLSCQSDALLAVPVSD